MKTLAFSVAVALVVSCCQGDPIPDLFDGDQTGGTTGTGQGQNLCGAGAIPFPAWASDSCTDANCQGFCEETGKTCCFDICESGLYPHLRPMGCDANNCEGTCESETVASYTFSVCCQDRMIGDGNQGNQNPCPDGKHFGGPDCNNCKGECVADGTTREACCVDMEDLPSLPGRNDHCKPVNPACTNDADCGQAHACRDGTCCWLAMETDKDFSVCKSIKNFIGRAMTLADCIVPLAQIIDVASEESFCSILWAGTDCIIGKLFSEQNERDICRTYIEDLVKSNPNGIIDEIEIIVKGLDPSVDFTRIKQYDASLCPGVFDCLFNDRGYDAGDTFPDEGVCNRCLCSAAGDVACTEIGCMPNGNAACTVMGQNIPSGDSYPLGNGCNTCFCGDGRIMCTNITRCERMKEKEEEEDDKDKERGGCPPLRLNSFGNCNKNDECGANKMCPAGQMCCSDGCSRVCKPDMGVCGNVTKMIEFSDSEDAQKCQLYFVEVFTTSQNSNQFCKSFWEGIECLATAFAKYNMKVDKAAKDECLGRMARHIMVAGTDALNKIKDRVAMDPTLNVQDVNHDPAACTVMKDRDDDVSMEDGDREDQPEYDSEVAAKCANMMEIKAKANQCKREHDQITSSNGYENKCKAFEKFIECIVGKLFTGPNKDEEMRKCIGDLHLFIEKHGEMLKMEFPALASLRVDECLEREHVCGEEMMPLEDVMCGASGRQCPAGSECRGQFCCPTERKGKCPMPKGVPLCDTECMTDDDCQDNYKCCDQGCGNKTCARLEEEEQSVCQKQFDEAVKNLQQMGICGDGKSSLEIPRCQGTGFAPNQGDYCVKPDGTKIKGSDHFMGNKDCTKVRDGKCPMPEAQCRGENVEITDICTHDDDCTNANEKCCVKKDGDHCLRVCSAPQAVADNEEVMIPDCPNSEPRSCCPITTCLGMKCPAHKGAVCKVNSCGGCHVEWFDIDGKKVENCSKGLTPCQEKQAMGMAMNMRAKSDMDKLVLFIKGLKEHHSEKKEKEETEYGDEAKEMHELPMDMYDYEEYSKEEEMRYKSILAERICKVLNDHGVCMNGGTCALTRPMTERSPYQICTCPQGYGGLFCEKKPIPDPCDSFTANCVINPCDVTKCPNHPTATCTSNYCGGCNAIFKLPDGTDVTYDCSDCRRNQMYINTAHTILQTLSPESEMLHKLMTVNPPPDYVMPLDIQCDAEGHYSPIQSWVFIPIISKAAVFKTCVNPESGKTIRRIPNTPIVFTGTMQNLTCTDRQTVDAKELHPKCWVSSEGVGPCEDASKCQWYYNNDNQRCEPGRGGYDPGTGPHGFNTLNQCYDKCRPMKPRKECPEVPDDVVGHCAEMCPAAGCPAGEMCCSNGCGHVCKSDLVDVEPEKPMPCKDKQCDYKTQYCNVVQNQETGEHEGECKNFQEHCTLEKDQGYGYGKIGAYYFNVKRRICMRFNYKGMGGNKNIFYSLHQCQTECAMRDYRYTDPVCPAPKLLMVPGMPMPDMCDCDTDCGEHGGVCCSDGNARVCSIPVRSCLDGHRCSFYGFCDEKGMCRCPDCMDSTDTQKVCGSDGETYNNECELQKHACKAMKKIVVKSTGDCPANPPEPTPEECRNNMVCAAVYMPVCVYDTTDSHFMHTYSNLCAMKVDKKCNNRKLEVLYPGECQRACGSCAIFNTECVNGQCGCNADCSLSFDGPVCGHPSGSDQTMTFNSICELRQYGCEKGAIYVISKHGPCDKDKKPEELLECPTMDDDSMMTEARPGMEQITCDVGEVGGFCDAETEKCCRLGQGTHCIPKTKLVRPKIMKEGVCPMISLLNFQQKDCYARKCDDNLPCKGDSICCNNFLCGHKTCASPVVKPKAAKVCGDGKFMVPHVMCDADTASGCPDKSDCTEVTRGMHKVHVCCAADADKDLFTEEVVFTTQLCHELKNIGVECANGGKCDPSLKESRICECPPGFSGPLCQLNTPPTSNKQCLREKAIMAMLSARLKDLVDKRIIGDTDEETVDEDEDSNDDMMGAMDHDSDGEVDDQELGRWADHVMAEEQLGMRFIKLLVAKGVKYLLHDVRCDENGDFEHAQCAIMLASHRQACFCIDKSDWTKHLPGPMAATHDKLDCSMLTNDMPEKCLMKPMEGTCDTTSLAGRYYFNPDAGDCKEFTDMLCADSNGNNFDSYETCRSSCSSRSWTNKECTKQCGTGQVCRLVHGTEECKDVTKPKEPEMHFEPKCDKDGNFLPKQCSGTVCTCVRPDDGTPIDNALGSGERLGCVKDQTAQHGVRVTQPGQGERMVCPDGSTPKFCEGRGQNPCDDCKATMQEQGQQGQGQQGQGQQGQGQQGQGQQGQGQQGQGQGQGQGQMMGGMMQKQTNEHGVCLECESCPADQGKKKCPGQCKTTCKQHPQATCRVNKCTCKEEFRNSENKIVKCNSAQSQCQKRKDAVYADYLTKAGEAAMKRLSGESSSSEDTEGPMTVIHCTEDGSYYAECTGRSDNRLDCYCLNANQFSRAHRTPQVVQMNVKPNCDEVQVQTKAKKVIGKMKFPGTLSAMPQAKQEKIIKAGCKRITDRIPVTCEGSLEEGSIIFVYTLEHDPIATVEADTSDLASLAATIQSEVNLNQFIFEVDGEQYIASEGQVTEFLTAEDVTTTPIDDDDDKKKKETTIIIVVVVVVVVVLLIILATGVYCYRKGKSKQKDIPFDDLHGKSNKAYENPAY